MVLAVALPLLLLAPQTQVPMLEAINSSITVVPAALGPASTREADSCL